MSKQVEFFYDYTSPNAYLAWTQLPALCDRHGAELVRRPVFLGGILKATGNTSPVSVEAKADWMFADIERHAAHYGVPFRMNPHFIFNTLAAMRGAVWAQQQGCLEAYDRALFEAAWTQGRDLGDPAVLQERIAAAGLDAGAAAEAIKRDEVKQALIAAGEAAVGRGVFGVPTLICAGELHFGQDRLPWVERALAAA